MTLTLAKWSLDEYHHMVDLGVLAARHVELINGEIVEISPEGPEHAQASTDTADDFRQKLGDRALIRDAKPITLPESGSEPEPDIAIVRPQRSTYRQRHPYPADIFLLLEFSKTSLKKDLETKRLTYAQAGIQEYWLVNLKDREVIILREPSNGNYHSEQRFKQGSITPLAFPDVEISVRQLLEG